MYRRLCLGGQSLYHDSRSGIGCRMFQLGRSGSDRRWAFLGACFIASESRADLLASAGSTGVAFPHSRRRASRQADPSAPRPGIRQKQQSESSVTDATAYAKQANGKQVSQRPCPGSSSTRQRPSGRTPALASPAQAPTSWDLLGSAAAVPDLEQLSSLVPAFSLDDILAGKPLPTDLSIGGIEGSDDATGIAGRDAEIGSGAASSDGPLHAAVDRQSFSGLKRRALRPWERATSPPTPSPPAPPQPPAFGKRTQSMGQPNEDPRSTPVVTSQQPDVLTFQRGTAASTTAAWHDGAPGGAIVMDERPGTSTADPAAGIVPRTPYHGSSDATVQMARTSCNASSSGSDLCLTSSSLSGCGPSEEAGIRRSRLQESPSARALAVEAVHLEGAAATRPAAATPKAAAVAAHPLSAAGSAPSLFAASAAESSGLLPRPVRTKAGRNPVASASLPETPGNETGDLEAIIAATATTASRSSLLSSSSEALGLSLLDFANNAPVVLAASGAAKVEAGSATNVVVRSTRAPRAVRVRSKEWLEATQVVETSTSAGSERGQLSGSGLVWEQIPSTNARGSNLVGQEFAFPGPGTWRQAADSSDMQQPLQSFAPGGGSAAAGASAPSELQPEMVSEPRGVLVLHEAPLRDALEAAAASTFLLPSREQLPETVDRHSWRLHAAVLFPDLYDADWHSCLFDFLFELWPELGRAHVTASGTGGSRRLLLSSEVELTEALEADAAGAGNLAAAAAPALPPPPRVQHASQLLEDAYAFVERCFNSDDFAICSAVVVSVLDCLSDQDELVEQLAVRLPPLMVQRLLVPLASRFQPPWVVEEWTMAVADAYPGYVPVATVPRRWQKLMDRLAAAEVVHPGGGLGVLHAVLEFEEMKRKGQRPETRDKGVSACHGKEANVEKAPKQTRRRQRAQAFASEPVHRTVGAGDIGTGGADGENGEVGTRALDGPRTNVGANNLSNKERGRGRRLQGSGQSQGRLRSIGLIGDCEAQPSVSQGSGSGAMVGEKVVSATASGA